MKQLLCTASLIAFLAAIPAAQTPAPSSLDARIARIEQNLLPAVRIAGRPDVRMTLADSMATHKVPAVSVAVIKDFKVEWARAYGLRDVEAKAPATVTTLFQAASISKPVTAVAALRLVERGALALDEDVNLRLTSWKVPDTPLTTEKKVTVRRILSHSAGLTVSGFPGYPSGTAVPSLRQVLDGDPPANSAPIRVDIQPGTRWRYSGGGYTVLQQLLIDVQHKPFPDIMKELVLTPAGMSDSVFLQPLPEPLLSRSAVGYTTRSTPVGGLRHVYPELAAAGLWTTPTDLCRFAIAIMNAWRGEPGGILSTEMARRMLTMDMAPSGLGVLLRGTGASLRFDHSGGNEGFACHLLAFPERGLGLAIMTNGDGGGALVAELERSIAAEYDLPGFAPVEKTIRPMTRAMLDQYAGSFEVDISGRKTPGRVEVSEDHLVVTVMGSPSHLYPESETRFFALDLSHVVEFRRDDRGVVTGFVADGQYVATRTR